MLQHRRLWEGQLEDRVVRNVVPVDLLVEDVIVDAKRQHRRRDFEIEQLLRR
jgi:hypothetical protein